MDWREIKNEKEKYAAYLCSREWSERKEAVRKRSGGKCERCLKNHATAVHHLTYIRKYAELLTDLQSICQGCHDFIHGKSDSDPKRRTRYTKRLAQWNLRNEWSILRCPECDDFIAASEAPEVSECDDDIVRTAFMCKCSQGHEFAFIVFVGKHGLHVVCGTPNSI
jgi:hypothetical protein